MSSIMESMGKKRSRPRRAFTAEFKAEIVELCQRGESSAGHRHDQDEWMSTQQDEYLAVLRGGEFPMMGRLFTADLDLNLDAEFEFGMARLLDGVGRYLTGH
jgi:hypothetical protein